MPTCAAASEAAGGQTHGTVWTGIQLPGTGQAGNGRHMLEPLASLGCRTCSDFEQGTHPASQPASHLHGKALEWVLQLPNLQLLLAVSFAAGHAVAACELAACAAGRQAGDTCAACTKESGVVQ